MERKHKAKADYGIRDYYKFYKNNYNKVDKEKFSKVIDDFNKEIIKAIIEDNLEYTVPYLNIEISIRKHKRKPTIKNGQLINNVPIDWKATKELWEKDPEAKEKNIRVRFRNSHTNNYVFRIYCKKFKCNIRNKSLFKFKPSRIFQRSLSKRIKDPNKDSLDAYLLY